MEFSSGHSKSLSIHFRRAQIQDLDRVNEIYHAAKFLPSRLQEHEAIWLAEAAFESSISKKGRQRTYIKIIALGGIEPLEGGASWEMGGIFVDEKFRGKGLARELIKRLKTEVPFGHTIYCTPFDHLVKLYEGFGFQLMESTPDLPASLLKKIGYCRKSFKTPTVLMRLET